METKFFEVRDDATCLVVVASRVWDIEHKGGSPRRLAMKLRCGYKAAVNGVVVYQLHDPSRGCYRSPEDWKDRTLQNAHRYIRDNWRDLADGAVVDVRWILGERLIPTISEFRDD